MLRGHIMFVCYVKTSVYLRTALRSTATAALVIYRFSYSHIIILVHKYIIYLILIN